jgi:Tol biopolymer transport system component
VFERQAGAARDLWAIRGNEEFQITNGPIAFSNPVPSRDGKKLFAFGTVSRAELIRYEPKTRQFASYLPGLSADNLAYSPGGESMAWVQIPDRTLWRSRADGSDRRQLTPVGFEAHMPRWSPDGKSIAFAGRPADPKERLRLYRVASAGGQAGDLLRDGTDQANPNWSPDGESLVFGGAPWLHGFAAGSGGIRQLDLRTGAVTAVPGSEGLWAPKWSPDGRFLAAETLDSRSLMLYDFRSGTWTTLANVGRVIGYPCWSHDGQFLYFNTSETPAGGPVIYRVAWNDRRLQLVVTLKSFKLAGSLFEWFGLAADDSLLFLRDASIQEVYALDVSFP